jgi:hypothetical protein
VLVGGPAGRLTKFTGPLTKFTGPVSKVTGLPTGLTQPEIEKWGRATTFSGRTTPDSVAEIRSPEPVSGTGSAVRPISGRMSAAVKLFTRDPR